MKSLFYAETKQKIVIHHKLIIKNLIILFHLSLSHIVNWSNMGASLTFLTPFSRTFLLIDVGDKLTFDNKLFAQKKRNMIKNGSV